MLNNNFEVFESDVISGRTLQVLRGTLLAQLGTEKYVARQRRHFNAKVRKAYLRRPRLFGAMLRALDEPRIRKLILDQLPDPVVHHLDLLIKDPRGPATMWHQDRYYWQAFDNPGSMMTLWITLVPLTPTNGCLRLVRSAQPQRELLEHVVFEHDKGQSQFAIAEAAVERCLAQTATVDVKLQAGGAVMFDSYAMHAAYPNDSDDFRLAYKIVLGSRGSLSRPYLFPIYGPAWQIGRTLNFLPQWAKTAARLRFPRLSGLGKALETSRSA
jgi:hypothetical protein